MMGNKKRLTLKEARRTSQIEEFIREHEKDGRGDLERLDKALKSPASRTKKSTPGTSSPDASDD